ncbi:hypothetical protein ACTI_25140 [Actinoplanes sp. OR16]|uniref:hypothetical protein n=1 Tax=Actinoplanes sp. OR16 TaxID=946334 RepID=UPI000F6ED2BE|nr:hypothetical protein [Actinoplanes sp. OR16]BBH65829.1 hypothetical protein ACTI_25140 [Actinoplanes sp. OR16]
MNLGADPAENHRILQEILSGTPGKLELPPGTHELADGLRVPGGWTITGDADTWLAVVERTGHPVLHVLGSDVSISDLGLRPAPSDPGEHGGDRGTGLTIGEYLYASPPDWISGVEVHRLRVDHGALRTANAVGVMGAVRDVIMRDVTVTGGYTGLAVHWGAVGDDVSTLVGPTYHPHNLDISGLMVFDAVEGFYLSSVHDVRVAGAVLTNVEMGFRLLPGDNTDRFVKSPDIGSRIEISDVDVSWSGPLYAVRVAGWGRSEIDGAVTVLDYRDTVIRDCHLRGQGTAGSWSPILVEQAPGVTLESLTITT